MTSPILATAQPLAAMVDLFRHEYAYTELYELDWETLEETYGPRFSEAEEAEDSAAYALALRDFLWEIPDGHVGMALGTGQRYLPRRDRRRLGNLAFGVGRRPYRGQLPVGRQPGRQRRHGTRR